MCYRLPATVTIFALILCAGFLLLHGADRREIRVFASPQMSYSVGVIQHDGADYVPLLDILDPLGTVEARQDGTNFSLTFKGPKTASLRAKNEDRKVTVGSGNIDLARNFVLIEGKGCIPLASISSVLMQFVDQQVEWHATSGRVVFASAGVKFLSDLRKNPSRLVLSFTSVVNPSITAQGNDLRILFPREPVVGSTDRQNYNDPLIIATNFAETARGGEVIVHGTAPIAATVGDGGRSITIAAGQQQQPAAAAPTPRTAQPITTPRAQFTVAIDPSHTGNDTGAKLANGITEKDITVAFARRLYLDLGKQGINTVVLKSGDQAMTPDQRAQMSNGARAAVYIGLHASSTGKGVRLYTAMMTPSLATPSHRNFEPWATAQSAWLDLSGQLAGSIALECNKQQIAVRAFSALVPPIQHIAAPAVTLEIGPPDSAMPDINSAQYQQQLSTAIVNAITAIRAKMEAAQ